MLNFFQRLDLYKSKNLFQVNGKYLDLYTNNLHSWYQNIDVIKDILVHASSLNIADEKEILYIRFFGEDLDDRIRLEFLENLNSANITLAVESGKSEVWEKIKPLPELPSRHFTTIAVVRFEPPKKKEVEQKQEEDIHNDPEFDKESRRKPRAIRGSSNDQESV